MYPVVSVIIPTFNIELFVEKCILSVVNQTYKQIEIIVIDDGSEDDTNKIIESLSHSLFNIKHFQKSHNGANKAREYGVMQAEGELIYFLDGDDYIEPLAIEKLVNIFKKKDVDIVVSNRKFLDYHSMEYIPVKVNIFVEEEILIGKDYVFRMLKDGTHFVYAKLYRKELFKNCEFHDFNSLEDLILSIQVCFFTDKICCSNSSDYNYIVNRPSSIMSSTQNHRHIDNYRARFEVFKFLEHRITSRDEKEKLLNFISMANYVMLFKVPAFSSIFKHEFEHSIKYALDNIKMLKSKQLKFFVLLSNINRNFGQFFIKMVQKQKKTISSWE